jgi:hypothetical protein
VERFRRVSARRHGVLLEGSWAAKVGSRRRFVPDLAEGEDVVLDAWVEEGDLEGAVADGVGLADDQVQVAGVER